MHPKDSSGFTNLWPALVVALDFFHFLTTKIRLYFILFKLLIKQVLLRYIDALHYSVNYVFFVYYFLLLVRVY